MATVKQPKSAETEPSSTVTRNGEVTEMPFSQRPEKKGILRATIISLLFSLAALLVGGFVFAAIASQKKDPERRDVAERSYNVTTFAIKPGTFREIVSAFGTAKADRQVMVSAEVAGLVTEIHPDLEVGTTVEPATAVGGGGRPSGISGGDTLLKIDQSTYARRIESLERQITQLGVQRKQLAIEKENDERLLETQQANLKTAQSELASKRRTRAAGAGNATQERTAELQARQYEEQIVRLKNSLGMFESNVESIDAQIDARKADLSVAELDLERTSIAPPFKGILSAVNVETGQYVRPGDPLVELTDINTIEIPISLTQSQFARIEPLLKNEDPPVVKLAVNETDPPQWEGTLVRAAPIADEATRTVDVFVEVDNSKQTTPLLPGTFVHARIEGPAMADLIVVPRDVVLQGKVYLAVDAPSEADAEPKAAADPDGDAELDSDAEAEPAGPSIIAKSQPVTVVRTVQGFAIVSEGLSDGDEVVMTNLDIVHDGAALSPQAVVSVQEELERQRVPAFRIAD